MFIKTLLLVTVAALVLGGPEEVSAKRDQAKVDEALRQLKGDDNEIFHGPEDRLKHDRQELKTKKYQKKQLLGHWGEHQPSKAGKRNRAKQLDLHDFDDERLQHVAFETKEEAKEEEKATQEAPSEEEQQQQQQPESLKKEKKKLRKKAATKSKKTLKLEQKRAEKLALKEQMRQAVSKGMDLDEVMAHLGEEQQAKFPKRFYKKFVKKYQLKRKNKSLKKGGGRAKGDKAAAKAARRAAAKQERKMVKKQQRKKNQQQEQQLP